MKVEFDLTDQRDCEVMLTVLQARLSVSVTPDPQPTSPQYVPTEQPAEEPPKQRRKRKAKAKPASAIEFKDVRGALSNVIQKKGPAGGTELLHSFELQQESSAFTPKNDEEKKRADGAVVGDPVRFVSWLTEAQWPELIKQAKAAVQADGG